MSGINMFVGSAQAQADSIKAMTQKEVQGYEAVLQSLSNFQDADDLQSDAYDNGKAFFSGVLIPLVQAGILVSEAVGAAAQKFVTDYQVRVDPGDLKSDDLDEKIRVLDTQVQHLEHLIQAINQSDLNEDLKRTGLKAQELQRERLLSVKEVLQETLDKLKEFHAESPEIFSGIAELEAAAKQGASQAKAGFTGQKFIMPSDLTWQSVVASKWKEYQDEKAEKELKKLKERIEKEGLPATKAEILADYHWSTIHNMYVHTKTGIPSPEVTNLYNKLVQAEHEPKQNEQLAFYNEMLRTGKHPITGEAITNADRINAKAMIYLFALEPFVGAWALAKYAQSLEVDGVENQASKKGSGAKTTKIERTQAELDDLARDPSCGFKIDEGTEIERKVGLALEERGDLGHIIRDPAIENNAEFIDTVTGKKYDVKSFQSYPNGHTSPKKGAFTVDKAMKNIKKEFNKGYDVIINTTDLMPEHVELLTNELKKQGMIDRILFYP